MTQKYHINSNNEAKPCHAKKYICRFGDNQHFDSLEQAQKESERILSQQHHTTHTISKNSVKKQFQNIPQEFTEENMIKVGEIYDQELQKRLSFDPYNTQLSYEQLQELQKQSHILFSEICDNGDNLKNNVYGPLAKDLHNAVKILPNAVKESLSQQNIYVKTTNINNKSHDGQHSYGKFQVFEKSKGKEVNEFIVQDAQNVPDNAVFFTDYSHDYESDYFGIKALVKREGKNVYDEVWIGNKSGIKTGKKISSSSDVYINGKLSTKKFPVYEHGYKVSTFGSIIETKKYGGKPSESILLHEYTHLVQAYDYSGSEKRMFESLAKDSYTSDDFGQCRSGFPDDYMGLANGRELLTRASEGIFYPCHNSYLYGNNRRDSADVVRRWVLGYWIMRNKSVE